MRFLSQHPGAGALSAWNIWEHLGLDLWKCTGFDPGEGRVVQIGEGKVFGSAGFVRMWIAGMASRRKDAHEVMGIGSNETVGYSSHGWRLADAQRDRSGLV